MYIIFTNEKDRMPDKALNENGEMPAYIVICSSTADNDLRLHTFRTRNEAMDTIEHLSRLAVFAEQLPPPAQA